MKLGKVFYLGVSVLFLILGLSGVFVPGLPATPFFLVASFCAAHGSKRFHHWMQRQSWYKKHVASYVANREMTLQTKVMILSVASVMILIAIITVPFWQVRVMLVILMVLKYAYFVFGIKTKAASSIEGDVNHD